ncbi:hypothetical protein [Aneurinibacillus terranovensis]|uniref:hypothetical protein n=1 Tax=Aneurinibacillus terranovensis TaxID=278991 RepID=UPI0004118F2E
MYKMTENQLILPDDFFLPFGGKLNKDIRWVTLAGLVPWWKAKEKYAKPFKKTFKKTFKGQKAFSVRIALGSLIIQQRLGLSDRETVQRHPSKRTAARSSIEERADGAKTAGTT